MVQFLSVIQNQEGFPTEKHFTEWLVSNSDLGGVRRE